VAPLEPDFIRATHFLNNIAPEEHPVYRKSI
jgi:hypothetical protein